MPEYSPKDEDNLAVEMIRAKVARVYSNEPDANDEIAESIGLSRRSKHQQFMYDLAKSGKDLATIQSEWHSYYSGLKREEKFEVWQEFYDSQALITGGGVRLKETAMDAQALSERKHEVAKPISRAKAKNKRSTKEIRQTIMDKVSAGGKLTPRHHLQSLAFGLGIGAVVVFIFLFGFFNEVLIAPFIQPSRASASTPIILSGNAPAPTTTPEVIIPKINVEIPTVFSETSTNEAAIENDLEDGVVHYPTTVLPGQIGNTAYFGHSSNNIFNNGKYKFAFVLLHTLVPGDTFYLTYNNKVYVYKVISRAIVPPNDVGVLGPVSGQTATATLITCDPPGTSINRLIVVGQQISPDPSTNVAATQTASTSTPTALPSNGPTLWSKFISTVYGKFLTVLAVGIIIFIIGRKIRTWANER